MLNMGFLAIKETQLWRQLSDQAGDFMPDQVICKFHEALIKYEGATIVTSISPL